MRLLSLARLLAPGTLAEERRLRREIFVEGPARRIGAAGISRRAVSAPLPQLGLCRQFPPAFHLAAGDARFRAERRGFPAARSRARADGAARARGISISSSPATRCFRAPLDLARLAAERAIGFSAGDSDEEERARSTSPQRRIVTPAYEPATEMLLALDPDRLPEADLPVLEAAMATAAAIGEPCARRWVWRTRRSWTRLTPRMLPTRRF